MCSSKYVQEQLPELQQIETIIQNASKEFLSHEILCHVFCDHDLLPVYALTLGNRAADIPCITFVAGIHGLERIGTQVVMAFLETLLKRLEWDLVFADILQQVRINVLTAMKRRFGWVGDTGLHHYCPGIGEKRVRQCNWKPRRYVIIWHVKCYRPPLV